MNHSLDRMREANAVGLIGSCVSRDVKEALFPGKRAEFLWRIATLSLMCEAPSVLQVTVTDGDRARKTIERDVNKTFDLQAVFDKPYVLIDFFRDMYGVLVLRDGRMVTNGLEIQQHGASAIGLDVVRRIELHDPRHPALWMESFQRFCDRANASDAQFLIVPVFQLASVWDETSFGVLPGLQPRQIVIRNLVLGYMQRIALAMLHNSLIVPILPETLEIDPAHEYGPGPYHFHNSAYRRAADIMASLPEYVPTLSADRHRREAIADAELQSWSAMITRPSVFARVREARLPTPAASPAPAPSIEMLLPLRLRNGERGSDHARARDGLIASINHFCDPAFVARLTIVVPGDEVADAASLVEACRIATRVIPEGDLIDVGRIGDIPRRGWYIQQLVKLAFAKLSQAPFYLTLDADVFLIGRLDASALHNGKAPIKLEPTAAHRGWWDASVRILEQEMSAAEFDPDRAFGVTPGFLNTALVEGMIARLDALAKSKGEADWVGYLCGLTSLQNNSWTEYSLYWTFVINTVDPATLYFPRDLYYYTHYPWHAARLVSDAERRERHLFCILQSSHVDDETFTGVVGQFLATCGSEADRPTA